jgi:O-antigen/teichoic acid export membrane protein
MSAFKEFVVHSSHYFVGQILLLLAGFISMPVMTRLLTKEEYGTMSLVFLTLTWLSTIARLGFAQSVTRFYAEHKKKGNSHLQSFCSNILFGTLFSSTTVVLGTLLVSYILEKNDAFKDLGYYLRMASVIVLFRVILNGFQEIYRAEKNHFLYNLLSISDRYGTLACSILLVYLYKSISGIFLGTIIAEGIVVAIFLTHLIWDKKIAFVKISREILSEANKYGLPLVVVGSSAFILNASDRYVIQYFLSADAVATYSVAHDLCDYLATFILTPIRLAIVPIIFSIWANQGDEATSTFISKTLRHICLLIIPTLFGFSFLGKEVIILLTSSKYADSSELIPYVASAVLIGGIDFILSSGLRTQKRTALLAWLVLAAGVVNLTLNVIFVPYYGIKSSAIITLITYLLKNLISYKISSKYLAIQLDFRAIVKSIAASTAMVTLLVVIGDLSQNIFADLIAKMLIGAFCYTTLLLLFDRESRESLSSLRKDKKLFFKSA